MANEVFEQLRPLGMEKHAGRLARICSDATQIIVGDGLLRTGVSRDDAGRAVVSDLDNAAARLTDDGAFLLDRVREIGEAGLQAALERAYVPDPAALESFRARAQRYGGILPMLEMQLGGAGDKLSAAHSKVKSDFEKIPTGPMTIMSADYGCVGAQMALGGGAGLMVGGMILKDGAMFTAGAAFFGIGMAAAAAFC